MGCFFGMLRNNSVNEFVMDLAPCLLGNTASYHLSEPLVGFIRDYQIREQHVLVLGLRGVRVQVQIHDLPLSTSLGFYDFR